jgi:hypothetical protein
VVESDPAPLFRFPALIFNPAPFTLAMRGTATLDDAV